MAGGLYALQMESHLAVHAGALTALALQGYSHYVRLGPETVFLFSKPRVILPAWVQKPRLATAGASLQNVNPVRESCSDGLSDADVSDPHIIAGARHSGMLATLA
jgi:hypothetical protein